MGKRRTPADFAGETFNGGTVITQQETPTDPQCQERLTAMEETLKGGGMIMTQPETPTRIPANGS